LPKRDKKEAKPLKAQKRDSDEGLHTKKSEGDKSAVALWLRVRSPVANT